MILLTLGGCAFLDSLFSGETVDIGDELDALSNPTVLESWYVGIAPVDASIDMSTSAWDQGALALVCAATATSAADLEDAPLMGADVTVSGTHITTTTLDELEDGAYQGSGESGLGYIVGDDVTITVDDGDATHSVEVTTIQAPQVEIPEEMDAGASLPVSIDADTYDGLLAVVVDLQNGETTYQNVPTDAISILDFLNGDSTTSIDIPGDAFSDESVYAVGIAGLILAEDDQYTNFNTILSRMMTGQFQFYPTSTVPLP